MNATDVTASMVQTLFQTAAKQSASVSLDGRAQQATARWGVMVLHVVACANNVALTVIVPAGSNRATISWFRAGGPANCGERMGYKVAALKVPSIYRPRIQTRRLGNLAGRIGECGLRCSPWLGRNLPRTRHSRVARRALAIRITYPSDPAGFRVGPHAIGE